MATNRNNTNLANRPEQVDWYKIDLTNLVTVTEMAKRAGLHTPQMSNMASREKDFPKPLHAPGIAGKVYYWPDVEQFLADRKARKENKATRSVQSAPDPALVEEMQKQMAELQKRFKEMGLAA